MNGLFAKLSVLVALALMLGTLTAVTAWGPAAAVPREMLYVANFGVHSVSVIDTRSSGTVAQVSLGGNPADLEINSSGRLVYAATLDVHGISIIDTPSNTVTATIPLVLGATAAPTDLAIDSSDTRLYVSISDYETNEHSVWVIDLASHAVIATIPVGQSPVAITIAPDDAHLYVALLEEDSVSVINTITNKVTATISVGDAPFNIVVRTHLKNGTLEGKPFQEYRRNWT